VSGTPDQTYAEVVLGRRSIRGYLDKPVPRALIEEVLALAMRSPSSMNTQPWHFHVITGEPLAASGAAIPNGFWRANPTAANSAGGSHLQASTRPAG